MFNENLQEEGLLETALIKGHVGWTKAIYSL